MQATAHFNRIVGNSVGLANTTAATVDATLNWWGSNTGPNTPGSDTTSGAATTGPWLVLTASAAPAVIGPGGTAVVTADLTTDSAGGTHPAAPFFPDQTRSPSARPGGRSPPPPFPPLGQGVVELHLDRGGRRDRLGDARQPDRHDADLGRGDHLPPAAIVATATAGSP